MEQKISIGVQDFEKLRTNHGFYVDKTDLIRKWWQETDDVTLITRPRRFGKTLNMSTLNCFFSNRYAGREDLFEDLNGLAFRGKNESPEKEHRNKDRNLCENEAEKKHWCAGF